MTHRKRDAQDSSHAKGEEIGDFHDESVDQFEMYKIYKDVTYNGLKDRMNSNNVIVTTCCATSGD